MAITAGLDLADVLSRIVRSACELVDARYGAMGVLGPDREHLVEFVTHGLTPAELRADRYEHFRRLGAIEERG